MRAMWRRLLPPSSSFLFVLIFVRLTIISPPPLSPTVHRVDAQVYPWSARLSTIGQQLTSNSSSPSFCVWHFAHRSRRRVRRRSVTFVTQSSLHYIDSFVNLLRLWTGHISYAIYLPDDSHLVRLHDLLLLLARIDVDFRRSADVHIFWPSDVSPCRSGYYEGEGSSCHTMQCIVDEMAKMAGDKEEFYPVNTARNIARSTVFTSHELVADVELLPISRHIADKLDVFVAHLPPSSRDVYVVPVFEVQEGSSPPSTKSQLYAGYLAQRLLPFHWLKARECHHLPLLLEWMQRRRGGGAVSIHTSTKWVPPCWEPVYVARVGGTPFYDERFRGYGKNKISQTYEMCLLDYTFNVLDNAWLAHRGIAQNDRRSLRRTTAARRVNDAVYEVLRSELRELYNSSSTVHCDAQNSYGHYSLLTTL